MDVLDYQVKSCVHIFSTHFYTTLLNDGVVGVSRWTTRKGLDIFTKKLLFIAINLNQHWSIMAVFNVGMINADLVEDELGDPYDLKAPVLFTWILLNYMMEQLLQEILEHG